MHVPAEPTTEGRRLVRAEGLDALVALLRREGRTVVGPVVREGAVVVDAIGSAADLPWGVGDRQGPGSYRLVEGAGAFGHNLGADSWKRWLFPPRARLFRLHLAGGGFGFEPGGAPGRPIAFLGPRACELAAMGVNDRVWRDGAAPDPGYVGRRGGLFVIAVQCATAGGSCFCASMNAGPRVTAGYDLALTEIVADGRSSFVAEVGSAAGGALLARIPSEPARESEAGAPERATEACARSLSARGDIEGLREGLLAALESPRWAGVAERCLGCGSCTAVCPTCFCTSVEDVTTLSGEVERHRRMSSCFTLEHSYLHGGAARVSLGARYRQWLTHKLSTWHDQFGTGGCTGCGRCVTWCPAGIDLIAEARQALQSGAAARKSFARPGQNVAVPLRPLPAPGRSAPALDLQAAAPPLFEEGGPGPPLRPPDGAPRRVLAPRGFRV